MWLFDRYTASRGRSPLPLTCGTGRPGRQDLAPPLRRPCSTGTAKIGRALQSVVSAGRTLFLMRLCRFWFASFLLRCTAWTVSGWCRPAVASADVISGSTYLLAHKQVQPAHSVIISRIPGRAAWLLVLDRCTGNTLQDRPLKAGNCPTRACIALRHGIRYAYGTSLHLCAAVCSCQMGLPLQSCSASADATSLRDQDENPFACRKQQGSSYERASAGATIPLRQQ
jgi:hypothetical protein